MAKNELYTVGVWKVKNGREKEFILAWAEFADWSTENVPGSMTARLIQDESQPGRMISFGPWENAEDVARWRAMPEFRLFFTKAKEMCEEVSPANMRLVAETAPVDRSL